MNEVLALFLEAALAGLLASVVAWLGGMNGRLAAFVGTAFAAVFLLLLYGVPNGQL